MWSSGSPYTIVDAIPWGPMGAGTHVIQVWVRSAGSSANYEAWGQGVPFVITP